MALRIEISDTTFVEILSSRPFKFVKRDLVDRYIYDQSSYAIPLTTNLVEFKVTGGSGRTLQVYHNDAVIALLENCSSEEKFYVPIEKGVNEIYVCDYIENTFRSNPIVLNAYNIDVFIWTYMKTLMDHRKEGLQAKQNLYIDDYKVTEDGILYETELEALKDKFGNLFLIFRPEEWDKTTFRNLLKSFINAYCNYPLTPKGFSLITAVFTEEEPVVYEYPKFIVCQCGGRLKLFADSNTWPFKFWWQDAQVHLRNRWYLLVGASGDLEVTTSGNETYVYVDSSKISGVEQTLVVQQSQTLPRSTSDKEVRILGVIVTNGSKIVEIYGSYRVGNGMVLWKKSTKSFGFEVYVTGNEDIDEFEKEQILTALSRISSAHKRGYLYFELSGNEEQDNDSCFNWMRRWGYFGDI